MKMSKTTKELPIMTRNLLSFKGKNFSLYVMEHWIHHRIVELIKGGRISNEKICTRLGISLKTLYRRRSEGTWTLPEIIAIEELYDENLVSKIVKYDNTEHAREVNELPHTYDEAPSYRFRVEIDPDRFNPQDLDQLNKELTERLIEKYKRRNGEG